MSVYRAVAHASKMMASFRPATPTSCAGRVLSCRYLSTQGSRRVVDTDGHFYGNYPSSAVVMESSDELQREHLDDLLGSKISALQIKNFVNPELIRKFAALEHADNMWTEYGHEHIDDTTGEKTYIFYGVYRPLIGQPFNSTYMEKDDSPVWDAYFGESIQQIRNIRKLSAPYASPVDSFRLLMDEIFGANIAVHPKFKKKMFCGMLRMMKAEGSEMSEEQPHVDQPPADFMELDSSFSVNIYLKMPEDKEGGFLELWDVPPVPFGADEAREDYDWRANLPPSFKMHPKAGDVILFSNRRPHAIGGFKHGSRIGLQIFVGLKDGRLHMWN